ncbi:MAG: glycosyltransferase family 9 protein [Rubrobacter sp.]
MEALRYCLGHHRANPDDHLSLVLNAAAPTELAELCPFVDEVYPVEFSEPSDSDARGALRRVPRRWEHVLDNPRRSVQAHLRAVPGFARYFEVSDLHFQASLARVPVGGDPPGYVPHQRLILDLPEEHRRRARDLIRDSKPRIAVLPAGSSERSLYPSTLSWEIVLGAMSGRFPEATFCLVGNLGTDERTRTNMSSAEVERLREACPRTVDRFDAGLLDQLAAVEACDVFLSPHSGFGMAALAVGTPWLTVSGGRWSEFFFNGVPFYSMLPDPQRFPIYSRFGTLPVLDDEDGEGPRTPAMSRERILADLDELVQVTESLVEGSLGYREALADHFERLLRFHGGDRSGIFSVDDVHSEFV